MCAAFIKAERAGLGDQRLRAWIDVYVKYVSTGQFRLADGTLARNRPLPESLWLDDLYMSVPCLAQAGKLTGERRYYDDAARQILQFSERMFVPEKGLFMHGWVQGMQHHPAFHWARANGWAFMAMAELLDVLPADHPQRAEILELFRAHAAALIANQGHAGLWHQLLDRRESYEETSASAMFVFGIARGINRGWLDPLSFGPPATLGWNAVAKKVNAKGQVEGTCVGTGMGWDPMFYMYRPVHLLAAHGYGPVFLAGAEIIEMRRKFPGHRRARRRRAVRQIAGELSAGSRQAPTVSSAWARSSAGKVRPMPRAAADIQHQRILGWIDHGDVARDASPARMRAVMRAAMRSCSD